MNDLLTLLDHAIDELVPVGSSRCSRSQMHTETATGTVNYLETNAVPVVPVVPVPKQETRDGISQTAEIILAGDHAEQGVAHASIPLNQREQREQRELERIHSEFQTLSSSRCGSDCAPANGNNGNGSRNFISNRKFGPGASARDESDLPDVFGERAAIAEFESGIPRAWAEGFARLQTMACPAGMRPDRWQEMVDDAGRFLARWGAQAAALGWSTLDVFGAHPTHPSSASIAPGSSSCCMATSWSPSPLIPHAPGGGAGDFQLTTDGRGRKPCRCGSWADDARARGVW